jgi:predicted NBD/HSP70 family sugar kinase
VSRKKTSNTEFENTTGVNADEIGGDGTASLAALQPVTGPGLKTQRRRDPIHTATPSTVRAINRSIILDLVRLYQPISRAELSQRTGIFRSNISDIVEELLEQELVVEKRGTAAGRGRVPMLLSLNRDGAGVLAVSVRAAKTVVAAAGLTGKVYDTVTFETPQEPSEFTKALLQTIARFRKRFAGQRAALQEIGIGVPGLVNATVGRVLWLPQLPDYSGLELQTEIEKACGISTAVDNDSNLATLAELWSNEAADLSNFVVVVIGDVGVGAGIVFNRELYRGHDTSFAAEFGHMIVDPAGPECRCGRCGCWELYVSDHATWTRYADDSRTFTELRFKELLDLAFAADKRALGAVTETAKYLSIGLSNIFLALNPEVIIVAGQIVNAWAMVQHSVRNVFRLPRLNVPLRAASLNMEELYLQGAVRLALRKAFAKPKLGW